MASQTWFKMNIFLLSWLLLILPASSLIRPAGIYPRGTPQQNKTVKTIPGTAAKSMNILSASNNLDGPQLPLVDGNSYEWWYFDAVSIDLRYSLTITFYTSLKSGFPFIRDSTRNNSASVAAVSVFWMWPGTKTSTTSELWLSADEAIITTEDNSSSGNFTGAGASWSGSPDLSHYNVTINSPENGISGTFRLKSRAPACYLGAGGVPVAGLNMNLASPASHIASSNAVPDAESIVDFTIRGRKIQFQGIGSHDNKWGDQPFQQNNVNLWYWGHGRIGNYSIVWADIFDVSGGEYASLCVSEGGTIVNMTDTSVLLNSHGSDNPPNINSSDPTSFTISMETTTGITLNVNITLKAKLADYGAPYSYKKFLGTMEGNVNYTNANQGNLVNKEEKLMTGGIAMLDQYVMKDAPPPAWVGS